jgi:hypothetical protein
MLIGQQQTIIRAEDCLLSSFKRWGKKLPNSRLSSFKRWGKKLPSSRVQQKGCRFAVSLGQRAGPGARKYQSFSIRTPSQQWPASGGRPDFCATVQVAVIDS